jgi:hypothetical protein
MADFAQLLPWLGWGVALLVALTGGGFVVARRRRHKEEADGIQSYLGGKITLMEWAQRLENKVAEQGQRIAALEAEMAGLRADHDSLKWSVRQEDADVTARIFTRADEHRKQMEG